MKKFRLLAMMCVLVSSLYMGTTNAHHSHATLDPNDVRKACKFHEAIFLSTLLKRTLRIFIKY